MEERKVINLRIPPDLYRSLKLLSAYTDEPMNSIITRILRKWETERGEAGS